MTKILLIDDDDSNRFTLSVLFEDEGFSVDTAGSFAEAKGMLLAEGARYDLVLFDQHLGDGTGTSLVPVLRGRMPEAKAILISGSIDGDEIAGAHFDAFLPKGAAFPDILALVQGTLPPRGAG